MNVLRFPGCRADTLLGYLKAVALVRLISRQYDRNVRGSWDDQTLQLIASFDRGDLERFLVEEYAPMPVLNPWNKGAGFDGKQDTAAAIIDRLRRSTHSRWRPYRDAIALIDEGLVATGLRERLQKDDVVAFLRANYADDALPWLDAAIVLGGDGATFPYLLGSGGNDGRLDFSVNFAARALDVVGDIPLSDRLELLRDALNDTSAAKLLPDVAIGQFGPRFAGGVNGTAGFDAASLVNPWDLVLAIEGAVAFSGGLSKRLPSGGERTTFPFAFSSVARGYTSASDDESARGEIWLPIWKGTATFPALIAMLRSGRADLPSAGDQPQVRTALNAIQATQAALTLGAGAGIGRFERMAFVQRNGLAYAATHVGTVHVDNSPAIALLSRGAAIWVERVRSRTEKLGKAVRDALRRFDTALFAFARFGEARPENEKRARARLCADVLVALADIEFGVAQRGHEELRPLEYLDAVILPLLDDGSIEHRIAVALASLGFPQRERDFRLSIEHVRYDENWRLSYTPDANVSLAPSLEATLGDMCERRTAAAEAGQIGWLRGSAGIGADDIANLADGLLDRDRLAKLIRAYALVRASNAYERDRGPGEGSDRQADPVPAAFALLKLVIDHPAACDRRIIARLRAGHVERALELALQRGRAVAEFPGPVRNISGAHVRDPRWYAAAALVPMRFTAADYAPLLNAALTRRFKPEISADRDVVNRYLLSLQPELQKEATS
jgi:CRISPR-associated protein Csx17